jgi:hypothetical protein
MNVYEKLNAAREEFHGLELKKTGHNKFAGYHYFELGDFLIPALKVFKKHGLCGVVTFEDKIAMMSIRNVEKPDEFIVISSPMGSAALKGCHEVQNIGAVETYQRRYLWVTALEIVEHDALDATTGKEERNANGTAKGPKHKPTDGAGDGMDPERKSAIEDMVSYMVECHRGGRDMEAIAIWYEGSDFQDNDERVYAWSLMSAESKLRSAIKANKPAETTTGRKAP